jgi:alpha-1,6-mannosyltransferase
MHIVDSTLFYGPASGGVRTYLTAKGRRLSSRPGVSHSLVVPGARDGFAHGVRSVGAPPLPFGQGYRFPVRRGPWVRALVELAPDVIEAGDPYLPAWAALEAGRALDVPVIGFYHSDLPRLVALRLGRVSAGWARAYVVALYRCFDRVLTPSRAMARRLAELGLTRVHVQPLGVDLERFHPRHRDPGLRRELGVGDGTRLLVFAGRASREKNLGVLLKASARLGNTYRLLLVGPGMPRRVPDNVTVLRGFQCPEAVARVLASADALVHAGDRETFGLVVLEAMASGIPVVGVRAGAVAELVPDGCGLLAEPGSPEGMAAAVRDLFAGDSQAMGRQARRHAAAHHGWDGVVDGLIGHYRAVTGLAAARGGSRLPAVPLPDVPGVPEVPVAVHE